MNDTRGNFLALCLLEALEDEDMRSFRKLLLEYDADPNQILLERGITPFHYGCGMDNLEMAENAIKIILDNGGNPNVRSADDVTPLHIAALFGRTKIMRMLLESGGNIHAADNRKYTPVQYAVYECHFDVIEIIKNFVFEQKIEEKRQKLENDKFFSPKKILKPSRNFLSVDDRTKHINYNFDVTSPYYINITHRRKPPLSSLLPPDTPQEIENGDENNTQCNSNTNSKNFTSRTLNDKDERRNLFELTEENLTELSNNISPEHSRISLIKSWREKVQHSKCRKSILARFNDIDSLLSGIMADDTLDFTNTILKSDEELKDEKLPPNKPFSSTAFGKLVEKLRKSSSSSQSDGSFLTAEELANKNNSLSESNFIRSPTQTVYQMSEQYEHIDHDEGLVFFEEKLVMNIPKSHLTVYQKEKQKEMNQSQSSLSTDFTIPLDYDTEALRAELTQFGEPPGPITKSTKRLYTKRLIKYKRNPEKMESLRALNDNNNQNPIFSIELQRTVRDVQWFERVPLEYLSLEEEMSEKFKNNNLHNKKWREGNLKQSFIYLLIDPRISNNLPCKSVFMNKHDIWKIFLSSIFYVGKGKSARPFSHLYDAMKVHSKTRELPQSNDRSPRPVPPSKLMQLTQKFVQEENSKLQRILGIWKSEYGVICLHVFHNILPADAYTREASIIDALGLQHLTNLKRGDYYGPAQTWTMRKRKFLGVGLLFKALQIYLAEGESQLFPSDLI